MKIKTGAVNKPSVKEVKKPFITGSAVDENTLKSSLFFFGTLLVVFFISFIACASASVGGVLLRIILNLAVIAVALMVFFNNGSRHGADAVARGEILYQKKEKGQTFSESEKKICYHAGKGFVTGMIGTIPFLVLAIILAASTSIQMTESGTLPSWMQTYTRRSDIGNALINYTQPEGMGVIDYCRAFVRICIIPFVNLFGSSDKTAMYILERISPVVLVLPAVSYGFGYMAGRNIRTKIHTAISENNNRRLKKERKRKAKNNGPKRETEQLN